MSSWSQIHIPKLKLCFASGLLVNPVFQVSVPLDPSPLPHPGEGRKGSQLQEKGRRLCSAGWVPMQRAPTSGQASLGEEQECAVLFQPWQSPQEPGAAHPGLSWRPRRLPAPWHKLSELTAASHPSLHLPPELSGNEERDRSVTSPSLGQPCLGDTSRRHFLSNGQLGGADSLRAGHLLPTLWLWGALGWTFPWLPGPLPLQASSWAPQLPSGLPPRGCSLNRKKKNLLPGREWPSHSR